MTRWAAPGIALLLLSCAPVPPPEPPPPDPAPVERSIVEIGRLELDAMLGELALSPDRTSLFAIDFSEGRVIRISTRDGEVKAEAQIGRANLLTLSVDGRLVVLAGPERDRGRILVLKAHNLELEATFPLPAPPRSIAVDYRRRLYISVSGQPAAVLRFSLKSKELEGGWRFPAREAWLAVSSSGRTLLASSMGRTPGLLRAYDLNQQAGSDPKAGPPHSDVEAAGVGGRFNVPGKGSLVAFPGGALVHVDESDSLTLRDVGNVGAVLASCSDPRRPELGLAAPQGVIRLLSPSGTELGRSAPSERIVTEIAMDAMRGLVFVFEGRPDSMSMIGGAPRVQGDLVFYDLSEWLE